MKLSAGSMVTQALRLLRPLGQGAMGSVWVADHADFDGQVAVKFIAAKQSRNPEAVARFNREAASAASIDNPHVVQILEHGTTTDGTSYLVMELLDGETLGERLARPVRSVFGSTSLLPGKSTNFFAIIFCPR